MSHYQIIIPSTLRQRPTRQEQCVAQIIATYYHSNVHFIAPRTQRAPDLYITKTRQTWEIKNIRGNSKRTVTNNLRSAKYQSPNIIISLLQSDMSATTATSRIKSYLASGPSGIQKLILITKTKKLLVIK